MKKQFGSTFLYYFLKKTKNRIEWSSNKKDWILGRYACLGSEVMKRMQFSSPVFNIQKGRVDYFVDTLTDNLCRARFLSQHAFLKREYIAPLVLQQEELYLLPTSKPRFVIMDSFSELADQRFFQRGCKSSFCATYSDVLKVAVEDEHIMCQGLLPIAQMEKKYLEFFDFIGRRFGDVPIIFLNFPAILDKREKFVTRANAISEVMKEISGKYRNLHSISLKDSDVYWSADAVAGKESFPYHFGTQTYEAFQGVTNDILEAVVGPLSRI